MALCQTLLLRDLRVATRHIPMILASVLLSLFTLPLLWLVLPLFVMPPAALICGWIGFKRAVLQAPEPLSLPLQLLYALPMVLAVVVLGLAFWIMATGYRA